MIGREQLRAAGRLIGALLFASALSLITAQHRSRSLFIDLERAQVDAKRLDVEHDRLRIDQARLSQPAYVESEARKIGMKPIDAAERLSESAYRGDEEVTRFPDSKRRTARERARGGTGPIASASMRILC